MITTKLEPAPGPAGTDDTGNLDHFYCCNPDVAYCGADLSDVPEAYFDEHGPTVCVVCADLDNQPCPRGCDTDSGGVA